MRASARPAARAAPPSTSPTTGAQAIAAAVRSLPCSVKHFDQCAGSRRHAGKVRAAARAPLEFAEYLARRQRHAWIDQNRRRAAAASSGADSTSPMPRMMRGARIQADRHVGADRRAPQPRGADRRAQDRLRAPAAAARPPRRPSRRRCPAATGIFFSSETARLSGRRYARAQFARTRLEHQIVVDRPARRRRTARTISSAVGAPGSSVSVSARSAKATRLSSS